MGVGVARSASTECGIVGLTGKPAKVPVILKRTPRVACTRERCLLTWINQRAQRSKHPEDVARKTPLLKHCLRGWCLVIPRPEKVKMRTG